MGQSNQLMRAGSSREPIMAPKPDGPRFYQLHRDEAKIQKPQWRFHSHEQVLNRLLLAKGRGKHIWFEKVDENENEKLEKSDMSM